MNQARGKSQPNEGIDTFVGKIYIREIKGLHSWRATHPETGVSVKGSRPVELVEELLHLICDSKIEKLTHYL